MAHWRRHFEEALNVHNAVGEDVLAKVMDNTDAETLEVTREEVEKAVLKLRNSKAAEKDIVVELLNSRGNVIGDWVTESVEKCGG